MDEVRPTSLTLCSHQERHADAHACSLRQPPARQRTNTLETRLHFLTAQPWHARRSCEDEVYAGVASSEGGSRIPLDVSRDAGGTREKAG
jgi:hypothetical protein